MILCQFLSKFLKQRPESGRLYVKIFLFLVTGIFFASLIFGCGSSRKDDDTTATEGDTERQQELDEIESLLGITPQEKQQAEPQKKPKKEDDTLGLLAAGAVPMGGEASGVDQKSFRIQKKKLQT